MAAREAPCCPRALPALGRGAVALCLLFYVRLQRGRRLREAARRRRAARCHQARARGRRRFAALWLGRLRARPAAAAGPGRAAAAALARAPRERRLWSKARSSAFWETVRAKAFSPREWAENFRLGPGTFDFLCGRLRAAIQRRDTNMRRAIPAEVRLAMTLWRLGACTEYRAVEQQFGVSRSTVCKILRDVCEAVVAILTPAFVGPPPAAAAAGFALPQMAGALGALHIPIRAPNDNAARYYNRRGCHSLVLQAAVDARGRFWDIDVGCPGRRSDAQVLRGSGLYRRAQRGELLPGPPRRLGGVPVPRYLLGGAGHPLLPWLMRPYRGAGLSPPRRRFNEAAAAAGAALAGAFGRLRGRWRCLQKRNDTDVAFLPTLVAACCTLHNVCEARGDACLPRWLPPEPPPAGPPAAAPPRRREPRPRRRRPPDGDEREETDEDDEEEEEEEDDEDEGQERDGDGQRQAARRIREALAMALWD